MKITADEATRRKQGLEQTVEKLVREFEDASGLRVEHIAVVRYPSFGYLSGIAACSARVVLP